MLLIGAAAVLFSFHMEYTYYDVEMCQCTFDSV